MSEHVEPAPPPDVYVESEHPSRHEHDGFDDGRPLPDEEGEHNAAAPGTSAEPRAAPDAEGQETWHTFLRRVGPQEIAQRDPDDPVRRGYVRNRHREVTEETQQRRRAVTASMYPATGRSPTSPTTDRSSTRDTGRRRPRSLQIQDRPLPRPPGSARDLPTLPGEYIVPRWQPDHDVSSCPICGHEFNVFFRRHHCRKCGRVVCANCSPHRITIPRQFIVHPPAEGEEPVARRTRTDVVDLAYSEEAVPRSARHNSALGGGEEVRLCNPCVPDPNPLPPPTYISPDGQHFTSYPRTDSMSSGGRNHRASIPPRPSQNLHSDHSRQLSSPQSGRHPPQRWSNGPNPYVTWGQSVNDPPAGTSGFSPFGSAPTHSRLQNWPLTGFLSGPASGPSAALPQMPPPPPPPPVREEDECPVCHMELPPKGPGGSEQEREAHVITCIQSHFSTSGPRRSSGAPPAPSTAIAAAVAASSATPAQAGTTSQSSVEGPFPGPASPRRRAPGMLVYHASEKDCVGEDGEVQECVICFEEFAVGDEMGRLECLCKFHRLCIRQWWDTKGVGACPVHQDGI